MAGWFASPSLTYGFGRPSLYEFGRAVGRLRSFEVCALPCILRTGKCIELAMRTACDYYACYFPRSSGGLDDEVGLLAWAPPKSPLTCSVVPLDHSAPDLLYGSGGRPYKGTLLHGIPLSTCPSSGCLRRLSNTGTGSPFHSAASMYRPNRCWNLDLANLRADLPVAITISGPAHVPLMTQHGSQLIVNDAQPVVFVSKADGGTEKKPRNLSFWKLARTHILLVNSRETPAHGS